MHLRVAPASRMNTASLLPPSCWPEQAPLPRSNRTFPPRVRRVSQGQSSAHISQELTIECSSDGLSSAQARGLGWAGKRAASGTLDVNTVCVNARGWDGNGTLGEQSDNGRESSKSKSDHVGNDSDR
jgi:hypothetical protein